MTQINLYLNLDLPVTEWTPIIVKIKAPQALHNTPPLLGAPKVIL